MLPKTFAGGALALVALMAFNAYRRGGTYAVKSWLSSIFLNKPYAKPRGAT